jgi:23S rRNA (uracil1939-C5)-methyltransferase
LKLTVEKQVYGGDGLGRLPADEHGRGKAVFVPFVLSGEIVEADLTEEKPGFARARLQQVVEPSAHRTHPPCPYFTGCGGCHYQHSTYQHQLEIKASILRENLRRIAKLELPTELQIHASPPWNYRNRTRMRVQAKPFALGYNRFGSHELAAIEQCPISSPLINRAISALWEMGRAGRIDSGVGEIEFFADAEDSQLLLEIYSGRGADRRGLADFAQQVCVGIRGTAGVVVFSTLPSPSGAKAEDAVLVHSGATTLEYQTAARTGVPAAQKYRVSAGSFFQTNRYLVDELLDIVCAGQSGRSALDLYAGVGLFAKVLAREFERVIAVESSPQSFADLEYNSPENAKAVRAGVDEYLERGGGRSADLIVVDPPRGGLGRRVTAELAKLKARRLTYVSCDPATLARDLVPLLAAGYGVEQAHLVDLFPQTFHIESVLQLAV